MNRICIAGLLTLLLAGCGSSSTLGTAADRLDRSSQRFYEQLHAAPTTGHTANDAALLADAARDFNRAVDRSRSRDQLQPSFERVAERYHHLRRQLDDRDHYERYHRAGFDSVTDAYLDVDRAMNYPDSRYHD